VHFSVAAASHPFFDFISVFVNENFNSSAVAKLSVGGWGGGVQRRRRRRRRRAELEFLARVLRSSSRRFISPMADYEEELQRLTADDDDAPPQRSPPRPSRCPHRCGSGVMLIPLPLDSELRVSISASTPARRRNFFLIFAACNGPPRSALPPPPSHARPQRSLALWLGTTGRTGSRTTTPSSGRLTSA
jgi:hypothetical protein